MDKIVVKVFAVASRHAPCGYTFQSFVGDTEGYDLVGWIKVHELEFVPSCSDEELNAWLVAGVESKILKEMADCQIRIGHLEEAKSKLLCLTSKNIKDTSVTVD